VCCDQREARHRWFVKPIWQSEDSCPDSADPSGYCGTNLGTSARSQVRDPYRCVLPTPRRTATSLNQRTHAVECCDQREARRHWFRQPFEMYSWRDGTSDPRFTSSRIGFFKKSPTTLWPNQMHERTIVASELFAENPRSYVPWETPNQSG
jgi:hypothetical protein